MRVVIESEGIELDGHLARPPGRPAAGEPVRGLVLCHGFPAGPRGAAKSAETYPELANRLAADAGWAVLTFNFRGTGDSGGDFSISGWLTDLRAAVDYMVHVEGVEGVWLAGFSTGGAIAICAAAHDERVAGVAALAAPADFDDWATEPKRFLEYARHVGVVRTRGFPEDFDAWARELAETRPVTAMPKVPPRPILIVHGSDDDVVPLIDARGLADTAGGDVELRVLTGANHRLRHDPRAIAVLSGWLDRQSL